MDFRRLILLSIFIFSLLLLWNAWKEHTNPKLAQTTSVSQQTGDTTPVPTPAPSETAQPGSPAVVPATAPATAQAIETATVQTDLVSAKISARGGDLIELTLQNHSSRGRSEERFMLFGEEHHYKAQSGLTGDAGLVLPNHNSIFTIVPGKRALEEGEQSIDLRLEATTPEGIKVAKIYTFTRGSYLISVTHEIENGSGQTLSPKLYFQLRRDGIDPEGSTTGMSSTFTGPAMFTQEGKYQKITFSDITKGKASFVNRANDGWIGMVQHFFVAAWVPVPDIPREFNVRKLAENSETPLFDAYVITPTAQVAPGAKVTQTTSLFAGPQIQSILQRLARPVSEGGIGAEGLPLVVDYGWLTILASPIFWLLQTINKFVGNWGWSIVLLTICIKAVFYPLSAASYKSMARMRTLTPKLTAMRERYGNDKQRLNVEMMTLYKTEKINPLGGCLPIVIQIPVFIALYWVLLGAVEMRGAPWIGWIQDLSAQDPYYILPIIMMATMFIQTKLNPTPPDPIQAKVMMFMPLVFGVMFFFFPAGLVLYWIVNNVLSITQQWQITRMIERGAQGGAKAANDEKA